VVTARAPRREQRRRSVSKAPVAEEEDRRAADQAPAAGAGQIDGGGAGQAAVAGEAADEPPDLVDVGREKVGAAIPEAGVVMRPPVVKRLPAS
jgi:hypothetical protein